jgi:hypothetical protein
MENKTAKYVDTDLHVITLIEINKQNMKLINCTLGFLPINVFLRNQWLQSLSQKPLNQMERNIKERLFSNHQHFG